MKEESGKYDDVLTTARERTGAQAIALIVFRGLHGDGFSVQCHDPRQLHALPGVLRFMADEIESGLPGATS
jgi:hypothetical protein